MDTDFIRRNPKLDKYGDYIIPIIIKSASRALGKCDYKCNILDNCNEKLVIRYFYEDKKDCAILNLDLDSMWLQTCSFDDFYITVADKISSIIEKKNISNYVLTDILEKTLENYKMISSIRKDWDSWTLRQ